MGTRRVAVVTGSNKGIGLSIVRGLCREFDGDVLLTARDEGRGLAAVDTLKSEGLSPKFHQLDITCGQSIARFRDFLKDTYQGLDVLVNNAGVLYLTDFFKTLPFLESEDMGHDQFPNLPFPDAARETIKVNFTGQVDVCNALFPILREHARVCNISSLAAAFILNDLGSSVKTEILKPDITMNELSDVMNRFVETAQTNTHVEQGYIDNAYSMSKVGVNVMSTIQQRELDKQGAQDIVVNSCSPGFVNTDMTRGKGAITPEEGAVTPVYLCLLPPNISSPRGKFVRNKEIVDWINYKQ